MTTRPNYAQINPYQYQRIDQKFLRYTNVPRYALPTKDPEEKPAAEKATEPEEAIEPTHAAGPEEAKNTDEVDEPEQAEDDESIPDVGAREL